MIFLPCGATGFVFLSSEKRMPFVRCHFAFSTMVTTKIGTHAGPLRGAGYGQLCGIRTRLNTTARAFDLRARWAHHYAVPALREVPKKPPILSTSGLTLCPYRLCPMVPAWVPDP